MLLPCAEGPVEHRQRVAAGGLRRAGRPRGPAGPHRVDDATTAIATATAVRARGCVSRSPGAPRRRAAVADHASPPSSASTSSTTRNSWSSARQEQVHVGRDRPVPGRGTVRCTARACPARRTTPGLRRPLRAHPARRRWPPRRTGLGRSAGRRCRGRRDGPRCAAPAGVRKVTGVMPTVASTRVWVTAHAAATGTATTAATRTATTSRRMTVATGPVAASRVRRGGFRL